MQIDWDCFKEIAFGSQIMGFKSFWSVGKEGCTATATLILIYSIILTLLTPILMIIAFPCSIKRGKNAKRKIA